MAGYRPENTGNYAVKERKDQVRYYMQKRYEVVQCTKCGNTCERIPDKDVPIEHKNILAENHVNEWYAYWCHVCNEADIEIISKKPRIDFKKMETEPLYKRFNIRQAEHWHVRFETQYCWCCNKKMRLVPNDIIDKELAEYLRENSIDDYEMYICPDTLTYKTIIYNEWKDG